MLGKFALTWDEFQPKMGGRFENLLQSSEFSDVTLVAKDNSRVKAHKVILESVSTFTFLVFTFLQGDPRKRLHLLQPDSHPHEGHPPPPDLPDGGGVGGAGGDHELPVPRPGGD